jgi:hypothetical protein
MPVTLRKQAPAGGVGDATPITASLVIGIDTGGTRSGALRAPATECVFNGSSCEARERQAEIEHDQDQEELVEGKLIHVSAKVFRAGMVVDTVSCNQRRISLQPTQAT